MMKKISLKCFLIASILLFALPVKADTDVYFSPSMQCEKQIIKNIEKSRKTIDIAVYSINNKDIVRALQQADKRGVKLRILTDRLQASNKYSLVCDIYQSGLNIKVHNHHKIEHNKFAIFDKKTVVTGSYNWTEAASKKNSENCLFIKGERETLKDYQKRFDRLWVNNRKKKSKLWLDIHCEKYSAKENKR